MESNQSSVQNITNNQEDQFEKLNKEENSKEYKLEDNDNNSDIDVIEEDELDDLEKLFNVKNINDVKETNIMCDNNSVCDDVDEKFEQEKKSKKINAEINIDETNSKVVISFYEHSQNGICDGQTEANNDIFCKKKMIPSIRKKNKYPAVDIQDFLVVKDDKNSKMCDKEKVKEIEFEININFKDNIV